MGLTGAGANFTKLLFSDDGIDGGLGYFERHVALNFNIVGGASSPVVCYGYEILDAITFQDGEDREREDGFELKSVDIPLVVERVSRRLGGIPGVDRSSNRGVERSSSNAQTDQSGNEGVKRPRCRISSGVCGLPLSAKIAATIFLSIGATAIWGLSLWKRLDGRSNSLQFIAAGLCAVGLLGLSVALWSWG